MKVSIPIATRFSLWLFAVAAFCNAAIGQTSETNSLKIGLIGDSTVCNYPLDTPRRGWGQVLPKFLAPGSLVINEALSGSSSKSFPAERWQALLKEKPDFILIQFGHNDAKIKDPSRYTDPQSSFRENLRHFVNDARAVGAIPVLVTPVRRRTFKSGVLTSELSPYAEAMKEEGISLSVLTVDLNELSGRLYSQLGEDGSTDFTINNVDQEDRPGQGDRTHFKEVGAWAMAAIVVQALAKLEPHFAEYVIVNVSSEIAAPSVTLDKAP